MEKQKNINWFKLEIAPQLSNYEIRYRYFEEGDFGSLNEVQVVNKNIGAVIDFWGIGWIGFFVWSKREKIDLLNIVLTNDDMQNSDNVVAQLISIMKNEQD